MHAVTDSRQQTTYPSPPAPTYPRTASVNPRGTFIKLSHSSLFQVSLQLPPSSNHCPVGLVYLELMHEQTHLLGGQKGAPLMLLPSAAAAEEACSLLLGSSSAAAAAPIRAASSTPSSSFLMDLGCWIEAVSPSSPLSSSPTPTIHPVPDPRLLGMGLRLLRHSIRCCLPGYATAIMDIITTRLGISQEQLMHSVPLLEWVCGSIDPPSLSLLHLAMQTGSLPLIHSLSAWAELHSVRPDWTVAGPSGICPLHLAALLPNAEAVVRGMLELPRPYGPDIAAAWLLCCSSDGRTPAELGSTVGLPASLDSLAHGVLVKAVENEPTFGVGANLGSVAESVSSASDASGIAAMMESLITGENGVGASCEATEVERELWRMPEAASEKAEGLAAAGADCGGRMGHCSGGSHAGSKPESNGGVLSGSLNGSPLSSPSHATEGGRSRLFRLLLLGFPDRSVERRYAQFKV